MKPFFLTATATTHIYTLSLHDALPIFPPRPAHHRGAPAPDHRERARGDPGHPRRAGSPAGGRPPQRRGEPAYRRSEEHTSELQSRPHLVCRLLLEKKKL